MISRAPVVFLVDVDNTLLDNDFLQEDLKAARRLRHLTVLQLADQIGISESALRRIENGTSRNTRGETLLAILVWAGRRGLTEFAGFSITPERPNISAAIAELSFASL